MSSDHGRLVRHADGWRLEDRASKNGCVVNGQHTRDALVHHGDLLELGHTFFRFRVAPAGDATADDPEDAAGGVPALATFDHELATRFARLRSVAGTPVPVLLLGETGTGKEVIAQAFHALAGRPGPFVGVNCGALPETLVEAELFGARKGAFSGAIADRPGLVRSADGGTLFLDEIAELRPESQAALLRALQEREVTPIGDTRPVKVDVRVCAATHRALDDLVAAGKFRRDLYARLAGFTLPLPPLRARIDDLGLLVRALLLRLPGGAAAQLTPAAARRLFVYAWPHNVRELEQVLAQAIALAGARPIDVDDLGELTAPAAEPRDRDASLQHTLTALLTEHHGNIAAVARVFGKDRMQIHRWVRRFGIDLTQFRR